MGGVDAIWEVDCVDVLRGDRLANALPELVPA
jgi:hypothetical protein